jgi:hypothetical protein
MKLSTLIAIAFILLCLAINLLIVRELQLRQIQLTKRVNSIELHILNYEPDNPYE